MDAYVYQLVVPQVRLNYRPSFLFIAPTLLLSFLASLQLRKLCHYMMHVWYFVLVVCWSTATAFAPVVQSLTIPQIPGTPYSQVLQLWNRHTGPFGGRRYDVLSQQRSLDRTHIIISWSCRGHTEGCVIALSIVAAESDMAGGMMFGRRRVEGACIPSAFAMDTDPITGNTVLIAGMSCDLHLDDDESMAAPQHAFITL